jgi:hypothetical protein
MRRTNAISRKKPSAWRPTMAAAINASERH